ncbi:MAG: hypothetical protein K5Q00_02790, partial [Gammaproteobacteria bacterium]|nr:hypothetical protein [Gammaproteobacteria bacterium]
RQAILGGLAQAFKNENGVSAVVIPTLVKGIVVEKTVALGIPAGLIVAQNPFEANTNTLTPTGAEFFNDIKLYGGDLAVAVGATPKANAVAAQLVKNGANSEQILVVPAAHLNNPNTVAVYIVRLPTMADLFIPLQGK